MSILASACGVMLLLLAFRISGRESGDSPDPVLLTLCAGAAFLIAVTVHRYRHLDDLIRVDDEGIRVVELPPRRMSWDKVDSMEIRPGPPGAYPVIWITHSQWRFRTSLVLDPRHYNFSPHDLLYEMTLLWRAARQRENGPAA